MKEHPILFSAPMVRAILAGTKTQTRRVVGLDTLRLSTTPGYDWTWRGQAPIRSIAQQRRHSGGCWQDVRERDLLALCPFGVPGDSLWVRETFATSGFLTKYHETGDPTHHGGPADPCCAYAATGTYRCGKAIPDAALASGNHRWKPSIRMPRWASRITLEITGIRVERLQAMSLDDARAEGIPQMYGEAVSLGLIERRAINSVGPDARDVWDNRTSRENFAALWDRINGARASWASNPWVWCISFKRVDAEVRHAG